MRGIVLLSLLAACPGPTDTDTDLDTDSDTVVDPDTDTDSDTTSTGLSRVDPGDCVPWGTMPPDSLARTGCVDPEDPSRPGPGFMPYSLNSPLWSDGADKERYIAMPLDAEATVTAEGDIVFPEGTVLGKWFYMDGELIEVRLFANGANGWRGASWEWDADAGDGVWRQQGATVTLEGGQTWSIPSMGQCRQCHTAAANVSLGPEIHQLDVTWEWPDGTVANSLDAFVQLGMLPSDLPTVPAVVDPFGDAPLEDRARSYLHSNCSGCHQPGGGTPYPMDFRITTPLADADACGVDAINTLGMSGMKRIAPGDADHSMVVQRMNNTTLRMPPVGTNVVDTAAVALLTEWINQLDACPEAR